MSAYSDALASGVLAYVEQAMSGGVRDPEELQALAAERYPQFSAATMARVVTVAVQAVTAAEQLQELWAGSSSTIPLPPAIPAADCSGFLVDVVISAAGAPMGTPERWFGRVEVQSLDSPDAVQEAVDALLERLADEHPYDFSEATIGFAVARVFACL
jgi:hypothetical protein